MTRSQWTIHVLEKARLQPPDGDPLWLDRRTAALLAWLAWEGPTDRAVLGGTLWPDSGESAARANLRQLLSRLRKLAGREVVETQGPLRIHEDVGVDLRALRQSVKGGRPPALALSPAILPGFDYTDSPELEAWIVATSEQLRNLLLGSSLDAADELARGGSYREAMEAGQRALVVDPYSERAHRRVIELHLQLGDRAAAVRAYRSCEQILRDELGVHPMSETTALVARLDEASPPLAPAIRGDGPLLSRLMDPPRFIGREKELARTREVLRERGIVFLYGPAGIGKSRLAREALAGWEKPYLIFDGRPADQYMPYSTHLRSLRKVLKTIPDMELEPWVRKGISRMFPDLMESEETSNSAVDEEFAKLFFGEANVEFMKALAKKDATIVVDDMQFHDEATRRLETYMLSSRIGADFKIGSIIPIRSDLTEELIVTMRRVLDAGGGELVELSPFSPAEKAAFIDSLAAPSDPELRRILDATEGNPGEILRAVSRFLTERSDDDP